jgi:hypothetical protein
MSVRFRLPAWCWRGLLAAALGVLPAGPLPAGERDPLPDAKARLKIEAQRVEKEFTQERAAAYKLVRRSDPQYVKAAEKIYTLLSMVRADTSLAPRRREQLIVTLKADLKTLKDIAGERRRSAGRDEDAASRLAVRDEVRRFTEERRGKRRRERVREADSVRSSRGRAVADASDLRRMRGERYIAALREVEKSAMPDGRVIRFPKDWVEKSKRRGTGIKMTDKERKILRVLNTVIKADFNEDSFRDVIDYLEKATGLSFSIDKRALDEVNVNYETTVKLKLRGTVRSVLKRVLADLGLAYVVKDEQIQITSLARAKEMTTTRVYYIGDLAGVVDVRLGPVYGQLAMLQNVAQIIGLIKQQVDPQSWQSNNPEAPGTITFDPVRMAVIVKQTAEVHFMLGGK